MIVTRIRRHIAEHYIGYAIASKFMYVIAFTLLSYGNTAWAVAMVSIALVVDSLTDGFMIETIRRSRMRLRAWRMIAYCLGGKRGMDRFLEKRALDYARRGGDLAHWERKFELFVFALTRIGHQPRGEGRLVDYLPRDEDPLDFTRRTAVAAA